MRALARAAPGLLLGRWSRLTAAAVTATTATATITNVAMPTSAEAAAAAAGTRPVLRPAVAARPSDGMFRRQARGKRTRTVVHLDDLPQGIVLPSGALNETQVGEENRTTRSSSRTGGKSRGSVAATADDETTATAAATATASATVDSPSSGSPAYPTVVLQARRNMQKFADCVLLTRVGGFYELYFEHAQEFGPLLNLKVAAKRTNAGPVPMAGFPFFQLDRFLKVLVHDLNRYVAIAEEYPHSAADKIKSGGLMHDRRVARIVTPGTLIDEHFMDPYTNNYVMAVHMSSVPSDDGAATSLSVPAFVPHPSPAPTHVAFAPAVPSVTAAAAPTSTSSASASVPASAPASTPAALSSVPLGLAWLDLSTGHFYTQTTTLAALGSVLARVAPREIVLDEDVQLWQGRNSSSSSSSSSSNIVHPLLTILDEDRQQQQQQQQRQVITYAPSPPSAADEGGSNGVSWLAEWAPMLESEIPAQTVQDITRPEVAAGSLLLHYVKDRLQGLAMKLQPPVRYEGMQIMTIDKNSMRSLEIKQTLRDGAFRGSLLHAIRRTVTKSGARLLNEWLSAPSTSLEVIVARQNLVSRFIQDEDLRDGITLLLRKSHDSHRLVQKFALGRGDPDDLLDLAKTVAATEDIVGLLQHARPQHADQEERDCLVAVAERIQLERPRAVAQRIRDSVDEEGLLHQHELEENEADSMLSLAQDVVQAEGSLETDGAGLRKTKSSGRDAKGATSASAAASASASASASTPTDAPTAAAAAARRRSSKPTSVRDYYGEDNEAWVMKPSASEGLGVLHDRLAALVREREALTDELRRRLKAPSLVLKWTPGLGHICHVRGRDATRGGRRKSKAGKADKADNETDEHEPATSPPSPETTTPTTVSSSRTTRSLHLPEWTALGQRLDQVRFQIRAEEQRVFHGLREAVVRSLVPLRRNAAVLDELDIATSFARLALEQNLSRPRLHRGTSTAIVGGRHPTVEGGLTEQGRSFTRNDCFVGSRGGAAGDQHGRVWLITGPNMAGKSTFLRQNALIVLLAQIGAYVPADCADLGLVDALFSRVGSADNLFRDQSTFMVEMLETAHILRQATPRSFVIMDEVGRGTTPEDGTAVAFAALHHLVHVNRCRTLFATHFHALADLAAGAGMTETTTTTTTTTRPTSTATEGPGIELYCTDVEEDDRGGFVYVHRLRRGVNRQSHALKVARLAGLPEQAIQVARDVLTKHGADLKISVQTEDHEPFIENGRSKEATA
ncbi:DNA mismatch repair protein [Niveomyces insectorum RCEF 264]|uniref:DNA mismatch repair protein n=1 Tax=Niveomyces insectorum RCEF 264 TaxID=1081102 RepID=A0A162JEX4_9HYPO|nr:DNA mismatch repair protein [Niveomyces insectorum RCEF 264]